MRRRRWRETVMSAKEGGPDSSQNQCSIRGWARRFQSFSEAGSIGTTLPDCWRAPPLVRDSSTNRRRVTMDELMSRLREEDVRDLGEVTQAHMDPDGTISVKKR